MGSLRGYVKAMQKKTLMRGGNGLIYIYWVLGLCSRSCWRHSGCFYTLATSNGLLRSCSDKATMVVGHWDATAIPRFCLLSSVFEFRTISPQRAIICADKLNLMSPTVPQGCISVLSLSNGGLSFKLGGLVAS